MPGERSKVTSILGWWVPSRTFLLAELRLYVKSTSLRELPISTHFTHCRGEWRARPLGQRCLESSPLQASGMFAVYPPAGSVTMVESRGVNASPSNKDLPELSADEETRCTRASASGRPASLPARFPTTMRTVLRWPSGANSH